MPDLTHRTNPPGALPAAVHPAACDWCGQKDNDPIKPADGQVTR